MKTKLSLTAADARLAIDSALAQASSHGWRVTVAVVDEGGYLLGLHRMDGTGPMSPEIALGKARMAALGRRPSRHWEERIRERPVFLKFDYGLPIQGGLPILVDGAALGGIGVSGVESHQDEQVAQAGINRLLEDPPGDGR